MVETCAGKAGERAGVDMSVIEAVQPGDEARQHAGIGRVKLAGDEGEAHAGQRLHAEAAQHGDVGVARADENHVLDDRPPGQPHAGAPGWTRRSPGAADRRVGSASILRRRRRAREKASTVMDSAATPKISTTATSRRSSEIAAST